MAGTVFDLDEGFPNLSDLVKKFKGVTLEDTNHTHEISDGSESALRSERTSKVAVKNRNGSKYSPKFPKYSSNLLIDSSEEALVFETKHSNKPSATPSHDDQSQPTRKGSIISSQNPGFIEPAIHLNREKNTGTTQRQERRKCQKMISGLEVGQNINSVTSKKLLDFNALKILLSEDECISECQQPKLLGEKKKATQKSKIKVSHIQNHDESLSILRKNSSIKHSEIVSGTEKEEKFDKLLPRNIALKSTELVSPKKIPRIPMIPHRPSSDAFWQQDIVNEWNDKFSPSKKTLSKSKVVTKNDKVEKIKPTLSPTMITCEVNKKSRQAKKEFSKIKSSLAESFFLELDEKITGGKVSSLAASSGGVKIEWNKKLNSTAGRSKWKCEIIKSKNTVPDGGPPPVKIIHHAAIELAEKVIDDEERLLNVMAHEFCHLATFMISNVRTNPHGREFKAWGVKCSKQFADYGVHVTTKHNYDIDYKYVWECEKCGIKVKRHSKSVDPARHCCSTCMSKLVQIRPVPRVSSAKICEYQLFVRDNLKDIRQENPGSPQKEVLALVGKRYKELKALRLRDKSQDQADQHDVTANVNTDSLAQKLAQLSLTSF